MFNFPCVPVDFDADDMRLFDVRTNPLSVFDEAWERHKGMGNAKLKSEDYDTYKTSIKHYTDALAIAMGPVRGGSSAVSPPPPRGPRSG
jgi:hypothetical protein